MDASPEHPGPQHPNHAERLPYRFQRPAVLITDDDAALRETLRATIEPFGV